jgi:tungstate transport system ATP-binding protein
MLYRLSGVTKGYEGRTVLDIPEMNIEAGGRYALLGPNGAGKTTLLNILAFLDRPTTGAIEFESSPVDFSRKGLQALRRKVVMVDQHPILFTRTVSQNVAYGLKIRKVPAKERGKKVAEALERVGMTAFAGAMAHRLSGGETQRVALARALALSPSVLLCDEPTASVDAENQSAILRILKELNESRGISLVFTSHDRRQAAALATETIYLDPGRPTGAGQENVFAATLTRGRDGRGICQIENGPRITLPYDGASVSARKVRVEFNPHLLKLAGPNEGHPSENTFSGRMLQATAEKEQIFCIVDIGVWIGVAVSESAYLRIHPMIGGAVSVQVPADAVRLV